MATIYRRDNSRFYWCRIGDQRRSTGTDNLVEAHEFAAKLEADAAPCRLRLSTALPRFVEDVVKTLRPETIKGYAAALRRVIVYADPYLEDIDSAWIKRYVHERSTTDGIAKIDTYSILRILKWFGSDVAHKYGGPPSREVTRYLTDDERTKLLGAISNPLYVSLTILTLETGMRKGEVLSLHWSQVSLGRREITIPAEKSKSKRPRVIPLSKLAVQVLSAQPRDCEMVFHKLGLPLSRYFVWFQTAREKVGLNDVRFHDLRHTFATQFVQRGGRQEILQRILGHSKITETSRYVYIRTEDLHTELDRVSSTDRG